MQRKYSGRERVLLAIFGFICLAGGLAMSAIAISNPEARRDPLAWVAAVGGFLLATVAAKIAATGTAWPYFEQRVVLPTESEGDDA
jgi:hypothetical protein